MGVVFIPIILSHDLNMACWCYCANKFPTSFSRDLSHCSDFVGCFYFKLHVLQIVGLSTLSPDSNCFSNQFEIVQCKSNAHRLRPHCIEFTRCWLLVATPPHNYHSALVRSVLQPAIILLLKMSRYVGQCVAWRSALTINYTCYTILVLTHNTQLCNPDQSRLNPPLKVDWD